MQVDAAKIKDARTARSWTQQHLADACDLSLRTVQRVERLGVAAPDTVLGLCSVLEIDQRQLLAKEEKRLVDARAGHIGGMVAILAISIGIAIGMALMYFIMAP